MDTIRQIEEKMVKLKQLKAGLEKEINEFNHDINHVENNELGFMNHFKAILARNMSRVGGTEAVLGEAYALKKNQEFDNAQEFIDYLKRSIGHTREAISKVDQVTANLEKLKSDLSYQISGIQKWLVEADQILK